MGDELLGECCDYSAFGVTLSNDFRIKFQVFVNSGRARVLINLGLLQFIEFWWVGS